MSGFIFKFNNKIFIGILLLVILLVSLNFVSAENPESDCLEPNLYLNDVNLNKDISVNDNVVADLNKDISVNDNVVADLNNDGSLNLNNVSSFSGNILNNASLSSVNDELSYTSLNIEDSNINSSYNSSRGVGEFTNFTFNGHVFNVSKVENNHFVISNEGNDLTGYIFNVKSEDDLKNISDSIKYSKVMDDIILINFYNDIYLTNIDTNVLFFNSRFIVINGNGFRIHTNRHFYYHFLTVGLNANVYIDNLTIMGFDNPIRNYGSVDLNNVSFINNDLPICNYGELTCNECSFLYNKGVQSAGIFITHSSHNFITNCIFKYNVLISSDEVVDICVDGDSVVYVFTLNGFNEKPICKCLNDGKVIFKNYTNSITRNLTVNSNFDIGKLGNELLRDNGESEVLNINFAPYFYNSVAFKKGSSFHSNNTYYFLHPHNKLVVINGNGGTVRLRYAEDRAATHFLVCDKDVTVVINNLTIIGFNTAIYNYGNMILNNVTFAENRLKYVHDFDVGGAIINYGVLTCINCSFINNYAQYGGAIFSNGSSSRLNLTNCFFENNTAYVGENGDCGFWKFMIKGNNYVQKKNDVVYLKGGSDVMVGGNSIVFAYHLDGNSTPNSEIKFGWMILLKILLF